MEGVAEEEGRFEGDGRASVHVTRGGDCELVVISGVNG